ncbi:MAG: helix-turn-helix transcriptional regulator [Candidatus Heimdallarchaeaceae archaeon]
MKLPPNKRYYYLLLLISISIVTLNLGYILPITGYNANFEGKHSQVYSLLPTVNLTTVIHTLSIDIIAEDTIDVEELFVIQNIGNETISKVSFWLNVSLASLIIEDVEGSLLFDWLPVTNNSHFITVNLRNAITHLEKASFICKYDLISAVPFVSGELISYYSFEFQPAISFFTSKLTISVMLPEKSFLHENDEGITPIFPENASQTLSHNRITVTWLFNNVSQNANVFVLTRYDPPLSQAEQGSIFSSFFNIFIFGFVIGLFLGISGTFWLIRYRERKAKREMGLSLLNENQLELIRIIYDHGGKISQRDLCDITGFSKSKISRNLVPLEERGLITREKWGRTYVVYLTETGEEVIEE